MAYAYWSILVFTLIHVKQIIISASALIEFMLHSRSLNISLLHFIGILRELCSILFVIHSTTIWGILVKVAGHFIASRWHYQASIAKSMMKNTWRIPKGLEATQPSIGDTTRHNGLHNIWQAILDLAIANQFRQLLAVSVNLISGRVAKKYNNENNTQTASIPLIDLFEILAELYAFVCMHIYVVEISV